MYYNVMYYNITSETHTHTHSHTHYTSPYIRRTGIRSTLIEMELYTYPAGVVDICMVDQMTETIQGLAGWLARLSWLVWLVVRWGSRGLGERVLEWMWRRARVE